MNVSGRFTGNFTPDTPDGGGGCVVFILVGTIGAYLISLATNLILKWKEATTIFLKIAGFVDYCLVYPGVWLTRLPRKWTGLGTTVWEYPNLQFVVTAFLFLVFFGIWALVLMLIMNILGQLFGGSALHGVAAIAIFNAVFIVLHFVTLFLFAKG